MDKMRMESIDMVDSSIEKVATLFPNCITETIDKNGLIKKAINFEMLKQMLSKDVSEGSENYEFTWVGKRASIVEANKPTRKTLRPYKDESVNWDSTENLYIEGDNLEVLKLIQESYLGKVKMIYIDPPYNTGNDFIYNDDFKMDTDEYSDILGEFDEYGNRMIKNSDSNGRFHSDWCSMIYSRLLLSRNLLTEDGVIFISIDDYEVENLKKMACEVFGEKNFIAQLVWERAYSPKNDAKYISNSHDYILMLAKDINSFVIGRLPRTEEANARYRNIDNDPRGPWKPGDLSVKTYNPNTDYQIVTPSGRVVEPPTGRCWRTSKEAFEKLVEDNRVYFGVDGNSVPQVKRFLSELKYEGMAPTSILFYKEVGHSQEGAKEVTKLLDSGAFDGPKPVRLLKRLLTLANLKSDSIVLDFFSGSSSTAHAVMEKNNEEGTSIKYIMVQIPEATDEKSEAYRSGFKTICDIGKERIRRAGNEIINSSPLSSGNLDIGFRVFKLDLSNMNDIYYAANEYTQDLLSMMQSNIKKDRTDLDLLFGCLLEWGLPLSLPCTSETIEGITIHSYNDTDLVACFDSDISEEIIMYIAKKQPLRVIFRDDSFNNSSSKINVSEIFKLLSPDTRVKVI